MTHSLDQCVCPGQEVLPYGTGGDWDWSKQLAPKTWTRVGSISIGLRSAVSYCVWLGLRPLRTDLLHFASSQCPLYTLRSHLRLPVHPRMIIGRHPASSPSVTPKPRARPRVPDADSFMPGSTSGTGLTVAARASKPRPPRSGLCQHRGLHSSAPSPLPTG